MKQNRRDFIKISALAVGSVLPVPRLEAKVEGQGHHAYFRRGSESYGEILRIAEQVISANDKWGNSYERTFKTDSIVEGHDVGQYSIDSVDVLVEDNDKDGRFDKGDRMSFHHQVESAELYGGMFPTFVHTNKDIIVELPQKVLEHFEQLRQSMGGKLPDVNYYGEVSPKSVPLKHRTFDEGGADKLIAQIKDDYLVEMLPTYQTFWRSLKPME